MLRSVNSRKQPWTQHQWVRLVAGSIVLISVSLSLINPYW